MDCGRAGVTFRGTDGDSGGRLCSNCAAYRCQGTCGRCGRHRRIAGVDPDGVAWCPTCQTAARTARADAQARERIIGAVAAADLTAERAVIAAVLDEIARHARTLRRIDRHLVEHPDVFGAGPTHAHHTVGRLVEALIDAGVALTVSYVDCEDCGRNMPTLRTKGQMLCGTCANKGRISECGCCGKPGLVATRDLDGGAVCAQCLNLERQAETGRHLTAEIVEAIGAITGIDYAAAVDAIAAAANTNRQLASLLDNLEREPELDVGCRRHPNTIRFSDELRARGADIPSADRPKPRPGIEHQCPACGRPTRQANTTNCRACVAENIAERTSTCASCGRATRDATAGLCGHCLRWAQHRCVTCESTTGLAREVGAVLCCHRCLLASELDALVGENPAGWVVEICAALRQAKSLASTRQWLATSPGGRHLARLVTGDIDLTHEELDRRSSRSIERLRGLLIATGALEPDQRRVEHIAEAVTSSAKAITSDADRRIVESWLRWRALPRIRRRAEAGKSIVHSAGNLRQQTRTIRRFVNGLNDQDRTLADCRQVDVDNWFSAPGATPALITPFLNWAADKRHLRAELDIPTTSGSREPTTRVDQQLRWSIARRLVNDDTLSPDDRVAGALVVLYAQPVTRIAGLCVDQLTEASDGEITISFESHQIDLTEPFASLAHQLPIRRQQGAADHLETRWLFPSTRPDRPVHPTTIANRLRRIGIDPRANRAAA
ncbi:MAG: hypothetical protein GY750_04855, partial [Lentisphaerae bacterium]|nr:hypothetical protein [Lentisphaerota bacterium]